LEEHRGLYQIMNHFNFKFYGSTSTIIVVVTVMIISAFALLGDSIYPEAEARIEINQFQPDVKYKIAIIILENSINAHDTTNTIVEQTQSLDKIKNAKILAGGLPHNDEFTPTILALIVRADAILDTGIVEIVIPEVVTEFKNADGDVILTVFEGDKLLFIVNHIYDFKCTSSRTTSSGGGGETFVTATCPEK